MDHPHAIAIGRIIAACFWTAACATEAVGTPSGSPQEDSPNVEGAPDGSSGRGNPGTPSTGSTSGGSGIGTGGSAGAGGAIGTGGTGTDAGVAHPDGAVVTSGTLGVWENVTPASLSLDPSGANGRCGVQDVVADPVRKSDLYAFTCYQGLWRSEDYGLTWVRVSPAGSLLEAGRQWAAAIDNDLNRNSAAAPTLYTVNGYGGGQNPLKSTDWGVSWTKLKEPATGGREVYSYDMDPYDNQHLIVGFHEAVGMAETEDGGNSWKFNSTPGSGNSIYAFFVDTGNAATTRKTWLIVGQDGSGGGTFRTTDSGATWNQVGTFVHPHGSAQIFSPGNGVVYASLTQGVHRSTDSGATWTTVTPTGGTAVAATPDFLYSSNGVGRSVMQAAPRNPGTAWTMMTLPPAFNQGAKRIAVINDGTHDILVQGSWMAGIWRYVEP